MENKKIIDIDRLARYHGNINNILSSKQDVLVSGSNIKTINNISILGEGDIMLGNKLLRRKNEDSYY